MRQFFILLVLLQAASLQSHLQALPRKAIDPARAIIELEERITERGHANAGEADDLSARLSQLAKLVPEDRLDMEPEMVAFLEKGYAFLCRVSPQLSTAAAENELRYRALLGGDERDIVKKEVGGATVVIRGDPSQKEIALTFDDGPCAGDGRNNGTSNLLDLLKEEGVRATFFVCGDSALSYPRLCKRIVNEGHAIGNHTKSHAKAKGLACLSDTAVVDEIETGETQILQALGTEEPLILFRCPYGSGVHSDRINKVLARNGFYDVFWTIDTLDWKTHSPEITCRRVLGSSYLRGGIALFHERVPDTTIAVKKIIDSLRGQGFRFVTVPQMLGVDNESSARVAYREAAGLYMSGDKAAATQAFMKLASSIDESVLADDSLHYAWLIAMETGDKETAAKTLDTMLHRFPHSLYIPSRLRVAGSTNAPAHDAPTARAETVVRSE